MKIKMIHNNKIFWNKFIQMSVMKKLNYQIIMTIKVLILNIIKVTKYKATIFNIPNNLWQNRI